MKVLFFIGLCLGLVYGICVPPEGLPEGGVERLIERASVVLYGTVESFGQVNCESGSLDPVELPLLQGQSFDAVVQLECAYGDSEAQIEGLQRVLVTGFGSAFDCLSSVTEGGDFLILAEPESALDEGSICDNSFPLPIYLARYDYIESAVLPTTDNNIELVEELKAAKACASVEVTENGTSVSSVSRAVSTGAPVTATSSSIATPTSPEAGATSTVVTSTSPEATTTTTVAPTPASLTTSAVGIPIIPSPSSVSSISISTSSASVPVPPTSSSSSFVSSSSSSMSAPVSSSVSSTSSSISAPASSSSSSVSTSSVSSSSSSSTMSTSSSVVADSDTDSEVDSKCSDLQPFCATLCSSVSLDLNLTCDIMPNSSFSLSCSCSDASLGEPEACISPRARCELLCGSKEETDFSCDQNGGALSTSCACVSVDEAVEIEEVDFCEQISEYCDAFCGKEGAIVGDCVAEDEVQSAVCTCAVEEKVEEVTTVSRSSFLDLSIEEEELAEVEELEELFISPEAEMMLDGFDLEEGANISATFDIAECLLPANTGVCTAYFTRYYFDGLNNECMEFAYGGCEGNMNKFMDKSTCEETCNGVLNTQIGQAFQTRLGYDPADFSGPICERPVRRGNCKAYMRRYYFDSEALECKEFIYGGCGSNGNNFYTEMECQDACSPSDK